MTQRFSSALLGLFFLMSLTILSACNTSKVNISKLPLTDLAGNEIQLSDYEGKMIFLNFWATWCGPCRQEKPKIHKLMEALGTDDYAYVVVSEEPIPTIKKYADKHAYKFDYLKINKNIKTLGVFFIPHTFIVDRKGNVVGSYQDQQDWNSEAMITKLKEYAK